MKILGVDWGLKRVGLAISEGELASPLTTITISGLDDGVTKVLQIAQQEEISLFVMGLPEGEMGKNVQRAAKAFALKGARLKLVDETLSTQRAQDLLLEIGAGKKARQDDNSVAAALILQNYLDDENEKN